VRIGIFGSGQLAWMLGREVKRRGDLLRVIGGVEGDPALSVADEFISTSKLQTEEECKNAIRGCDFLTFESEFLNFSLWSSVLSNEKNIKKVFPVLSAMSLLSDKWEQKKLFQKYSLPTAKAQVYEGFLPDGKWVAKWSRQGYDGYGNFFLSRDHLKDDWKLFLKKAEEKGALVYLEEEIPFEAECSLIVARDLKGNFLNYPLFVSEQKKGICEWVYGPAEDFLPTASKESRNLLSHIKFLLDDLSYVGVAAFELFWSQGKLYLNEVAPRVHNTGHITLDAFSINQFELHLMAASGFESTTIKSLSQKFMMKNLLGSEDFDRLICKLDAEVFWQKVENTKSIQESALYWYGKKELRKGRKLGHINQLFSDEVNLHSMKNILHLQEKKAWARIRENV
jgi:5-(carboxyamino)imidazole ribonucleotide synthase